VPQIRTMLVEPKLGPMEKGQADGISVRSMEMFQAFGFADQGHARVGLDQRNHVLGARRPRHAPLTRVARVQDVPDGTSEMPHVLINQARVHDMFLDVMRNAPTRLEPDYGLKVATCHRSTQQAADHPVTVTLEHTAPGREGQTHTVRANYVIGCDGARSQCAHGHWRRAARRRGAPGLGRDRCAGRDRLPRLAHEVLRALQDEGILMVLPREGGHLVRLYVELDNLGEHERVADRGMGLRTSSPRRSASFGPSSWT
jgi:phenol 2-monooxygenase